MAAPGGQSRRATIPERKRSIRWNGCASPSRSQEDTVVDEELQRNVTRLIGTLPKKLRDALLLAGTGEHTYEQISQMLGAPLGTVKWRVSEARRVLKKKLAALGYAYE